MRRYIPAILVAVFAVLMPACSLAAGLCCQLSSGVQEDLPGVVSPGARQVTVQLNYSFTLMDKLREGSERRSLEEVQAEGRYTSIPTKMEMTKYSLTAAYGFSPRLKAFVTIPHIRNTMDMSRFMSMGMGMPSWMVHAMKPTMGLGDITVMALYRIYVNNDVMPTSVVAAGLGVKTPTGSSTEKSAAGKFVHAHMQPGTGSWDPLFSVICTKMLNPFLFQADAAYQLTTRNSEGYEFGDSFDLDLFGKYAVTRSFTVTGGLTYFHTNMASDRFGNYTDLSSILDDPANTGGESIWFSPGIQIQPLRNGIIDMKVQFPLWERVNGVQLVSSYRILAGVSYSF